MNRRPRTIFRCESRPHGFVCIDRRTAEDEGLSFAARGLLIYLLAKPDDWGVSVTDIRRRGGLGKTRVYQLVEELMAAGYLERVQERVERGRFARTVYRVYERPRSELPNAVEPVPVTRNATEGETEPGRPVARARPNTNRTNHPDKQLLTEPKRSSSSEAAFLAAEATVAKLRATFEARRSRHGDLHERPRSERKTPR